MAENRTTTVPSGIALVQELANTYNVESHEEELATPETLHAWLVDRGLLAAADTVDHEGWARALEVREAIRDLALANNGPPPSEEALQTINRAGRRSRLVARFGADGATLEGATGGIDGAIGDLLGIVYTAMAEGTWGRLKACAQDSCRWVFYDRSKNHSGKWCSMAVCGNRVKARAYREARKAEA